MADDPKKTGKPDDSRVSQQPHELAYLAKKFGITQQQASQAVTSAGPMRADVEAYIRRKWG